MAVHQFGGNLGLMLAETLTAAQAAATFDDLRGVGQVSVQLSGTFTATVTFEVSNDGTTWTAIPLTTPAGATPASTATAAGLWVGAVSGYHKFRVRCSAHTSGSIVATLRATYSAAVLPPFDVNIESTTSVRTTLTALPVLTVGGAYTAGDCFGTKISVASAHSVSGGTLIIDQVTVFDKSDAANNAFDILFWGTDPSASTFTDNSAPSIDETTDLGNLDGWVRLVSSDFVDVGAAKSGVIAPSIATSRLPLSVKLAATTLYVVVLSQNTNSYTAGDISIRIKARQE